MFKKKKVKLISNNYIGKNNKIEKQLYNYEHIKEWKQNIIKRIYTLTQKEYITIF